VHGESAKVMKFDDVKARLDSTGMVPETSSPEALGKKIKLEVDKWAKVVKALNLSVN